jgi:hypothetical protein
MNSRGLDVSSDGMISGPVLRTKMLARRRGTNSIRATHKFATRQTRVITDEPPNSHFEFTNLPYDVRREVYLLLLANRDIYLTIDYLPLSSKGSNPKHDNTVRMAKETDIGGFFKLSPTYLFPAGPRGFRPSKDMQIPLSILRVSHQIYHEARLLPYTENTFHMDIDTLEYFLYRRALYQKQSLRSLSLRADSFGLFKSFYHQYFEFVMLKASLSLAGLRSLKVFTQSYMVLEDGDRTRWIEGLKIWGIHRLDLAAEVIVRGGMNLDVDVESEPESDVVDPIGPVISRRKLKQMKDITRKVCQELSDRDMVEKNRRLATKIFKQLPEHLRKSQIEIVARSKGQNIAAWLPGCPETMV